jgi:hypothetical protein
MLVCALASCYVKSLQHNSVTYLCSDVSCEDKVEVRKDNVGLLLVPLKNPEADDGLAELVDSVVGIVPGGCSLTS